MSSSPVPPEGDPTPIEHAHTSTANPSHQQQQAQVGYDMDHAHTTGSARGHHARSGSFGRSTSRASHPRDDNDEKERHRDPNLDITLPYQVLSRDANMDEFRVEVPGGAIPGPIEPPEVAQAAARAESLRLQRTQTPGQAPPPVAGAGERRYKLVTFEPNDPENPKNWSKARKWYVTLVVSVTCFVVAFASSVITADIGGPAKRFNVSTEVVMLTVTVFVCGFGVGPLVFAPLSEVYGRRVIYASTLALAVIFIIPCAVAQNIGTLIVCRLIDGIAFSAPMTLVGGTLADMWKNEERGVPMATFSAAPFLGPAIGPLIGGFLSDHRGWRWLYWLQLIMAGFVWCMITFTVPETYAPTILLKRARRLRKETGEPDYVTEQELDTRPFAQQLKVFLMRPLQLLFMELIVFLLSLYMSVLYGLLYMFFVAFPVVYQEGKGFSASKTGMMFIPVAVGVVLSAVCSPLINKHYLSMSRKYNGAPPAELRLVPMMMSCWFIPIGLFIFAWTSYPDVHWAGPMMGGFPVGFGFIFLYNSANNYLVDSYQHQAASALAAKTFLRSFWGASTVLFTIQMYHRLGDQWASSLLAFISLACCAIPFLFWFYGARIRQHSRFAYGGEDDATASSGSGSDSDPEKQTQPVDDETILRQTVTQQPVSY